MATRKQLWHPDEVRKRIQASQLINRLTNHVNSATPLMDSSQVTAAIKLLGKVLPDLAATQITGADGGALRVHNIIEYCIVDPPKN